MGPSITLVYRLEVAAPVELRGFSVLRVARPWSADRYAIGVEASADVRHVRRAALQAHLRAQCTQLATCAAPAAEIYLCGPVRIEAGRPASAQEVRWLIGRAFCRGLGDPPADALALLGSRVEVGPGSLRIVSELGESHQAFLRLGPNRAPFGPLESLDFPVDGAIDAAASVSLCVAAPSRAELGRRMERLRRAYGRVELRRPPGEQLRLFAAHLPGRHEAETTGSVIAPPPTQALGTATGPCIGLTAGPAPRPVLFDPAQAWSGAPTGPAPRPVLSDPAQAWSGAPTVTLLAGGPGSGTSFCLRLIAYQAFIRGSVVCALGDRAWHHLPWRATIIRAPRDPALLRLATAFGFGLAARDPRRHGLLALDDADALLADRAGRKLLRRLARLGRERNVSILVAAASPGELDELVGPAFRFGAGLPRGYCLLRDSAGRTGVVRVDPLDPGLRAALSA